MTKRSSPGETAWSLLLAFLGAIVAVYMISVVWDAIFEPTYFDPFSTFVVFPLIGSLVVVPICLIVTLLAWVCFVQGRRWVRYSRVWAEVVAGALAVAICSAFYLLVVLTLPTLQGLFSLRSFFLALAVIVTICLARGVGRPWEAALAPTQTTQLPATADEVV